MHDRYKAQAKVIGEEGHRRLLRSTVAVVGLGSLGCMAAPYMFGAGLKRIILVDHSMVTTQNLYRQLLYTALDLGAPKAVRAALHLRYLNPQVRITTSTEKLDEDNAEDLLKGCDLILDCLDNLNSRFALHRTATRLGIPVVYGSSQGWYGEVAVFASKETEPCYQCYIPTAPEDHSFRMGRGDFGPMCGCVGALQAAEAIKILAKAGEPSYGYLFRIDASNMSTTSLKLVRDPYCPNHG